MIQNTMDRWAIDVPARSCGGEERETERVMIISCIHQGYELYGSDRSFVTTVESIRAAFPEADIEVVLPRHGPIVPMLEAVATRITIEPLWVLRRRTLLRLATVELVRLPAAMIRAWSRLRRSHLVYINTSVVTDYILASRLCPGKAILHIHEIPQGFALKVLRAMVCWSAADIVFNSKATRDAFALPATRATRVIYNGVAGPASPEPTTFDGRRPLRLLMLGRLSRIKGQEILVEALTRLGDRLQPTVRIVGDAFEDATRAQRLGDLIAARGLSDSVELLRFAPDPSAHYRWADVVVVPSRLPESLGRVAIEAMAFGRPPVASAIGGLGEVVADGETGWLVEPDSPDALAEALRRIIDEPTAWRGFAAAARRRYEALFSETAAASATSAVLHDRLRRDRHGLARRIGRSALSGPG